MNIFILSENPIEAAQMQCDKHVVKMILETAQMLCSPFPNGEAPYKRTHFNHPCTVWARESFINYKWLILHGLALCQEYTLRYGKVHKSQAVIEWCSDHIHELSFNKVNQTPFVMAMNDDFKKDNAVDSYRNFYNLDKSRFAEWNKGRIEPFWFRRDYA